MLLYASLCSVPDICLHTLLHTKDNRAASRLNAEIFLSVFSHNRLVASSSLAGPTTYIQSCLRAALFLSAHSRCPSAFVKLQLRYARAKRNHTHTD